MAIVETEHQDGVLVIRMNRPERMNALGAEMNEGLIDAWCELRDSSDVEVGIITGVGRAFCAGEDMKDTIQRGEWQPGFPGSPRRENPFNAGTLDKPVIAAVNGYAMGHGFIMAERCDLRVGLAGAIFEVSEGKRRLLGGYNHGVINNIPTVITTELAFVFRFTSERLYEIGFLNRVAPTQEELVPTARAMAEHLLTLPPASRVNTLMLMRSLRPKMDPVLQGYARRLDGHGAKEDLMESRRAFDEKRPPRWKGWNNPGDRENTPTLEQYRAELAAQEPQE